VATPTPFSFRVEAVGDYILQILVEGHLGAGEAADYLRVLGRMVAEARRRDPSRPIGLLYIDRLSGFESLKVPRAHGEFFRAVSADGDVRPRRRETDRVAQAADQSVRRRGAGAALAAVASRRARRAAQPRQTIVVQCVTCWSPSGASASKRRTTRS
jgi:hypothetical protein